jgi:hypothetical protein
MSTRKQSPRNRAFRPESDPLESRQLLSGVVTGTDIDGDIWTLRLIGPGSISVVKQNDSSGNPAPLTSQSEISTITIGGTDPTKTRLIGSVIKSPTGDGKVFFQNLEGLPSRSEHFSGVGQGLVSINMPQFWLGNTTPTSTSATPSAPHIGLPDGTDTLRFGGVDTTHNPITTTSTTQDTKTVVELGLPMYGGTRVIIDKSISSTQSAPPASGSTTNRTIQHQVEFAVSGRLQLFQANEIVGDAANPPGQFQNQNSAASGTGGTELVATLGGQTGFFTTTTSGVVKGAVGGQMGFVRVGGNATNFTTIVEDPTGQSTDHISNYYVGGETNNVMLIAPTGANTVVFGKGMDTVEIRAHVINTLKANRGAINSNVAVDRQIGLVDIGGAVVNTKVISGAVQNYSSIISTVIGQSSSVFVSSSPAAPPLPLNAQTDGGMTVHVAGDITNSVFAASTEPFNGVYGDPHELVLPTGHINAKVEGTTNNATATPSSPANAFYAQKVNLNKSPVAPAGVPEQPFAHRSHSFLPGVHSLVKPGATLEKSAVTTTRSAQPHAKLLTVKVGKSTPKGPLASGTTT